MSYRVKEIEDRAALQGCDVNCEVTPLVVYQYPTVSSTAPVVSKLLLIHKEEDVWKEGLWAAVKSLFEPNISYKVILHQRRLQNDHVHVQGFVLFEADTDGVELSKEALEILNQLLKQLLEGGQVTMTKGLLKELVLPTPTKNPSLAHYLVEVIKRNPSAHPDWPKLFQALLLSACTTDNVDDARLLADNGADLDSATSAEGDTAIHVAVSNKAHNVLNYLLSKPSSTQMLKRMNSRGFSPLELARKSDNQKAVASLVQAGSSMKTFSGTKKTALHRAASFNRSETIWAMLEEREFKDPSDKRRSSWSVDDAINQMDDNGDTPLMLAVKSGFVESCFYLLLAGAQPNLHHSVSGDTALHFAAAMDDLTLVKLLTVFDAEIASTNHNKQSTIDRAKDDKTRTLLKDTVKLRKKARDVYINAPPFCPALSKRSNLKYLLATDGGGIRNCAACQILIGIEKRMQQLQPNCTPLPHYFQFLSGTSSGAYGALLFAYKNTSLLACWGLIFRSLTDVLIKPMSEREQAITNFMKEIYGDDTTMSTVTNPKVMITTTLADRNPPYLQLIRNYKPPCNVTISDLPLHRTEWKVWEAARASSAAPVFFPPFEGVYIDGGIMANNPTLDAMTEVLGLLEEEGEQASLGCVVSLGNGVPPTTEVKDIDLFFGSRMDAIINLPKALRGARSLVELFTSQLTQSDGQEVTRARAWCKSIGVPYFRFSPPLAEEVNLSETRIPVIIDLLYTTQKYILENASEIDKLCRIILQGTPAEPGL